MSAVPEIADFARARTDYAAGISAKEIYASRLGGSSSPTADLTTVIQAALDAFASAPVRLILDRSCAGNLRLHSNTTLEMMPGITLTAPAGSGLPVLSNYTQRGGAETLVDTNIHIICHAGATVDGNRRGGASGGSDPRFSGSGDTQKFIFATSFIGVQGLRIHGMRVYDPCTYGVFLHNVFDFEVNRYQMELVAPVTATHTNQDGFHMVGPCANGVLRDAVIMSSDDAVAYNAADGHLNSLEAHFYPSNVTAGTIENVNTYNLTLDRCIYGLRVLTNLTSQNVKNCGVYGVTGTLGGRLLIVSNYSLPGPGACDSFTLDGVRVSSYGPGVAGESDMIFDIGDSVGTLDIRRCTLVGWDDRKTAWLRSDLAAKRIHLGICREDVSGVTSTGTALALVEGSVSRMDVNTRWNRDSSLSVGGRVVDIASGGSVAQLDITDVQANRISDIVRVQAGGTLTAVHAGKITCPAADGAVFNVGTGVTVAEAILPVYVGPTPTSGAGTITSQLGAGFGVGGRGAGIGA